MFCQNVIRLLDQQKYDLFLASWNVGTTDCILYTRWVPKITFLKPLGLYCEVVWFMSDSVYLNMCQIRVSSV